MPQRPRLVQLPLAGKIFLCVLAGVYVIYLAALVNFLHPFATTPSETVVEHAVSTSPTVELQHWTAAAMLNASDPDQQLSQNPSLQPASIDTAKGWPGKQKGLPPSSGESTFPLSTVGKVFFSNQSGMNFVCSGTAVRSANRNTVDTAGHCIYWSGEWVQNVIFCPLYERGAGPYGCWAARDLEAPSDWVDQPPNDYHHDMGMIIVAPNEQGNLTDVVGGAGWAYNQSINQPFYAYGYPAGYPFDGQTRQSCADGSIGKSWQHGSGTVVSIPCNMTGGSSGGPWFIKVGKQWYLNGHNDFTSSIQPDHMFSPYYDDTWYTLYKKAQNS